MRLLHLGGALLLSGCSGKLVPIGSNPADGGSSPGAGGVEAQGGLVLSGGASGTALTSGGYAAGGAPEPNGGAGGSAANGGSAGIGMATGMVGCARQLASGDSHTCILYDDGRVACMGENDGGELGRGTFSPPAALAPIEALTGVSTIAAGGDVSCAVSSGEVFCWGDNRHHQLARPSTEVMGSASPEHVVFEQQAPVVQLSLGRSHACALDAVGHAFCWGEHAQGAPSLPRLMPQIGLAPGQYLQGGGAHLRLIDAGRLYEVLWGAAGGSDGLSVVPGASTGVIENALGVAHECLLKRSGRVFCKGEGYPDFYSAVTDLTTIAVDVEAGDGFTCALTNVGYAVCRGRNDLGQLGDGDATPLMNPLATIVHGIDHLVELSAGRTHACARRADGGVWCWGSLPGAPLRTVPERVSGPASARSCIGVTGVAKPWGEPPVPRPMDSLSDSTLAQVQNSCRCIHGSDSAMLESCVREQGGVLNGCLQALGSDAGEYASCRGQLVWNSAVCANECFGRGSIPEECEVPPIACGAYGVLEFCSQATLACDASRAAEVFAAQTCDGTRDCANGFDEANCEPDAGAFTCADGSRTELALVRDGTEHCSDGSDEWL